MSLQRSGAVIGKAAEKAAPVTLKRRHPHRELPARLGQFHREWRDCELRACRLDPQVADLLPSEIERLHVEHVRHHRLQSLHGGGGGDGHGLLGRVTCARARLANPAALGELLRREQDGVYPPTNVAFEIEAERQRGARRRNAPVVLGLGHIHHRPFRAEFPLHARQIRVPDDDHSSSGGAEISRARCVSPSTPRAWRASGLLPAW